MRLGRLAATGLLAGAIVAFAVALLVPRRRPGPNTSPPAGARHAWGTTTAAAAPATGPAADMPVAAGGRRLDVTAAERSVGHRLPPGAASPVRTAPGRGA